jgi:hypothetical protein
MRSNHLSQIVAAIGLLAAGGCGSTQAPSELRQSTHSYQFSITVPAGPPIAADSVTYIIAVRDRNNDQPIETGEGRLFARSGEQIVAPLIKAPQVGQYRATIQFPHAGDWVLGIRFRSPGATEMELTQWGQQVRTAEGPQKGTPLAPPWRWAK